MDAWAKNVSIGRFKDQLHWCSAALYWQTHNMIDVCHQLITFGTHCSSCSNILLKFSNIVYYFLKSGHNLGHQGSIFINWS